LLLLHWLAQQLLLVQTRVVDMAVVAGMIVAPVMLTLLAVTVLKKHVHTGVMTKNALDVVHVTVAQDLANVQMDIPVHLVNAPLAQTVVVAKVHAIPRLVCAIVLVDTLVMIAVHVYAQKVMTH
jgi:hypothetical protein